ncbi:MAG: hypothetical protein HY553_11525 [Elusimicrobia bacterium]|nr:hypothetical protein [Elusimicrobiota bacterium]
MKRFLLPAVASLLVLLGPGAEAGPRKRKLAPLTSWPSAAQTAKSLSGVFTAAPGDAGLQSSEAGTPSAQDGRGGLAFGRATGVEASVLRSGLPSGAHASASTQHASSTKTAAGASEPEPASASCRGEDWVDLSCSVPPQPEVQALTAEEREECEAEARAAPSYLGAECNPAAWWLRRHHYETPAYLDAQAGCRERVHNVWWTRRTFDSCPETFGSGQRRMIEGPAGALVTFKVQTQKFQPGIHHVNEWVAAERPIAQPRSVKAWISAEPAGEAVAGLGCSREGVFIFSVDLRYLLYDAGGPVPADTQRAVDTYQWCLLKAERVYYINFEITECDAAVCGVVSELYLH